MKSFLRLSDLSSREISSLLSDALALKKQKKQKKILDGKILILLFEKESTRTRVSFEAGMARLGGTTITLASGQSQISRGETYADTARVLSRYGHALMFRTFKHETAEELARFSSVPVINGLTDLFHPCQILADLMTIIEKKKKLSSIKIAYVGDGNNMANSWLEAACLLGFKLYVATPKGFEPTWDYKKEFGEKKNIVLTNDPFEALDEADVVNTDTWFSMGQVVSDKKRNTFHPFQINEKILKRSKNNCLILHCLPAHRGEEITSDVLDGKNSVVFDEAENRMWAQMALLKKLMT